MSFASGNTISNAIMIFAPLFACFLAVQQRLEKPVIFSYISITGNSLNTTIDTITLNSPLKQGSVENRIHVNIYVGVNTVIVIHILSVICFSWL